LSYLFYIYRARDLRQLHSFPTRRSSDLLQKTTIVAPFDGLIGLRNVSVGDYVGPGDVLVPIESVDPLQVDFRIPEQYLSLVHPGLKLRLRFDALPGQIREGEVGAVSPSIDVGGRSILLRANVGNADDA